MSRAAAEFQPSQPRQFVVLVGLFAFSPRKVEAASLPIPVGNHSSRQCGICHQRVQVDWGGNATTARRTLAHRDLVDSRGSGHSFDLSVNTIRSPQRAVTTDNLRDARRRRLNRGQGGPAGGEGVRLRLGGRRLMPGRVLLVDESRLMTSCRSSSSSRRSSLLPASRAGPGGRDCRPRKSSNRSRSADALSCARHRQRSSCSRRSMSSRPHATAPSKSDGQASSDGRDELFFDNARRGKLNVRRFHEAVLMASASASLSLTRRLVGGAQRLATAKRVG